MRQTVAIGFLAAVNLLASFGFLGLAVVEFGAGHLTDAFFAASVAPQLVMAVLTGSISSVAIPLLANEDESTRRMWSWHLLRIATLTIVGLGRALGLAASVWGSARGSC